MSEKNEFRLNEVISLVKRMGFVCCWERWEGMIDIYLRYAINFTFSMVNSRYNTFISWLFLIAIFFFLTVLGNGILYYYLNINVFKQISLTPKVATFQMTFGIVGLTCFCIAASLKIKRITIDMQKHRICIKDFVTQQSSIYEFSDLNGYQDMIVNHGRSATSYKAIGLIKDNEVLFKIDSFYYSNVDKLREGLKELKYLGINIDWKKQHF